MSYLLSMANWNLFRYYGNNYLSAAVPGQGQCGRLVRQVAVMGFFKTLFWYGLGGNWELERVYHGIDQV
jgi:hypothetical protein